MEALRLDLHLQWLPREANAEADSLSNMRTEGFDPSRRIEVVVAELPLKVLPDLLEGATAFYEEVQPARLQRRRRGKRRRLRETDPWCSASHGAVGPALRAQIIVSAASQNHSSHAYIHAPCT